MTLRVPDLDDKRFEALVEEARGLIPRVAPAWTDHNRSDPGITFLELLAWRAEMLSYRIGRVGKSTRRAMLRLVDVDPEPARPARVSIVTDPGASRADGTLLPAGTVLAAGPERPHYELEEDVYVVGPALREAVTIHGTEEVDHTIANGRSEMPYWPFGADGTADAFVLRLDAPTKVPALQLDFEVWDDDLMAIANPTAPRRTPHIPNPLVWEIGDGSCWTPAEGVLDGTWGLATSGRVEIPIPPPLRTRCTEVRIRRAQGATFEPSPRLHAVRLDVLPSRQVRTIIDEWKRPGLGEPDQTYELDAATPLPELEPEGRFRVGDLVDAKGLLEAIADRRGPAEELARRLHAVGWRDTGAQIPGDASQAATIAYDLARALDRALDVAPPTRDDPPLPLRDELPPSKPDDPVNRRVMRHWLERSFPAYVRARGLSVSTVEDAGPQRWMCLEPPHSFDDAGPADRVYVHEGNRIVFGNGINGRAPVAWVRVDSYRVTDGAEGGIAAESSWTLPGGEMPGWRGTNPKASSSGRPEEPLEHAEGRACRRYDDEHAMTNEHDIAARARSTPGARVARVRVIGGRDPRWPCLETPGHCTVAIAAFTRPRTERSERPAASTGLVTAVQRHLDQVRPVGETFHVVSATIVPITIAAWIRLDPHAEEARVRREVETALGERLRAHGAAATPDERCSDFGADVHASQLIATIDAVRGVRGVERIAMHRPGKAETQEHIALEPLEIAVFGGVTLTSAGIRGGRS